MYKQLFHFSTKTAIHSPICVIGGGTAGISVVSQLSREPEMFYHNIRVFEAKKMHYYQPGFTVIGGLDEKSLVQKRTKDMFNHQIPLTEERVLKVNPEQNQLQTEDGKIYTYDHLVIATGVELRYDTIKGAQEALDDSECPVGSIYDYKYAIKTNKLAKQFKGGKALFTQPSLPIKCAGAPQKITFLLEDQWKKNNINKQIEYHTCSNVIFGVPKYAEALTKQHSQKGNQVVLQSNLVEVKGKERVAVFQNMATKELSEVKFDFLHLVPAQAAPAYISQSNLGNAQGYVDVDKFTLQHVKYPNVWSLGDSSSLPTSKTAAATFSQSPVLVHNLYNFYKKKDLSCKATYDGYSACPIYVGGNKLILAEFKYDGAPGETFWNNQQEPSYLLFLLKRYFFAIVYWRFVPIGLWFGKKGTIKPQY